MATANNHWYSWGAAKRPRYQKQPECRIGGMGANLMPESNKLKAFNVTLCREIESGPNAGHDESFHLSFTVAEMDSMFAYYSELKAKYGVAE